MIDHSPAIKKQNSKTLYVKTNGMIAQVGIKHPDKNSSKPYKLIDIIMGNIPEALAGLQAQGYRIIKI